MRATSADAAKRRRFLRENWARGSRILGYDSPSQEATYKIVVNHEGQYSLWPAGRANPLGWSDAGKGGTREECLPHIEALWTDMRPLSLRKAMDEPGRVRVDAPRPGSGPVRGAGSGP